MSDRNDNSFCCIDYDYNSFARFARSATSPLFAYVTIPAPNSSVQTAAPRDCVRFGCCSPIASIRFKLLFPVSVRFRCSQSPISTAPRLRPLWLLLPDCSTAAPRLRPLQLQLSDCVRFDCCFFVDFEVQ